MCEFENAFLKKRAVVTALFVSVGDQKKEILMLINIFFSVGLASVI